VGLLQRLAAAAAARRDADSCYLEIGVFQGLTLVNTALAAPDLPCFGIDNFATLDPDSKNISIVQDRIARFGTTNATLINEDFEAALADLHARIGGRKVAVYFVDGPHDYRSQLVCLLFARRYLAPGAAIVIDDANYPDVRLATRDFLLAHPDYKLLFEAYSPDHPANLSEPERRRWEGEWLNGVHVLVHDPDGRLPDMLPQTGPARARQLDSWLVNRLRLVDLAPEALRMADAAVRGDAGAEAASRTVLTEAYAAREAEFVRRREDRNMYAEGLPEARFNRP
jgi:hypothetical protein